MWVGNRAKTSNWTDAFSFVSLSFTFFRLLLPPNELLTLYWFSNISTEMNQGHEGNVKDER